jgi:hypothetical protein
MKSWVRTWRWSIMVGMAVLVAILTLLRSSLVPKLHEVAFQLHMRDSLGVIEATLPEAREEWRRVNSGNHNRDVRPMGLASLDSLLTVCGIEHEPLKAVAENGRTSLSVTFSGSALGLHRVWREMSGWSVVRWSLQPREKGVGGTFHLVDSADGARL